METQNYYLKKIGDFLLLDFQFRKKHFRALTLILIFFFYFVPNSYGQNLYENLISVSGGSSNSEIHAISYAKAPNNNYIIGCNLDSIINGFEYSVILKTDASGDTLFVRGYNKYSSLSRAISSSDYSLFACGKSSINNQNGRFNIFKTDSSGNLQWGYEYSDTISEAKDIIESFSGSSSDGIVACGNNNGEIQVTKVNGSNGNIIFSKKYSFGTTDYSSSIVQTSDGNYVVCGTSDSLILVYKINSSTGNIIWTNTFTVQIGNAGVDILEDVSNDLFVLGSFYDTNANDRRNVVLRLDSLGSSVWSKSYTTQSSTIIANESIGFEQSEDGNIVIASNYYYKNFGVRAPFVFKITTAGVPFNYLLINKNLTANNQNYTTGLSLSHDLGYIILTKNNQDVSLIYKSSDNLVIGVCGANSNKVVDSTVSISNLVPTDNVSTISTKNNYSNSSPAEIIRVLECRSCTSHPISLSKSGLQRICEGDSLLVTANTFGDTMKYDYYIWTNKTTNNSFHTYKNQAYLKDSGNYKVVGHFLGTFTPCNDSSIVSVTIQIDKNPTAQFSASGLCNQLKVDFANQSAVPSPNFILKNYWYFGDTAYSSTDTSNAKHPSFTFGSQDTFDVKLVVTANNGCKDSITKPVIVPIPYEVPNAGFDTSYTTCSYYIDFTDTSTTDSAEIVFRYWNFGDPSSGYDSIGFGQTAMHKYDDTGTYSVRLIVYTKEGCTDTITQTVNVSTINPYPLTIISGNSDWKASGNVFYTVTNPPPAPQYGEYRWYRNGRPIEDDTCYCPIMSPKYPGSYLLRAFGDCGWETSNEIEIKPACDDPALNTSLTGSNIAAGFYAASGGYYIASDISINSGDTVTFFNTALVMDDCVRITVEDGGHLELDSVVVSSCGFWQGIIVENGTFGNSYVEIEKTHLSYATLGVLNNDGARLLLINDTFENNYAHYGGFSNNSSTQDSVRIVNSLFGRVRRDYTTLTQACGHDDWDGIIKYENLAGDTDRWRPYVFIDKAKDVVVGANEFALDEFYRPPVPDTIPLNLYNGRVALLSTNSSEIDIVLNNFDVSTQRHVVLKDITSPISKVRGNMFNGGFASYFLGNLVTGVYVEDADSLNIHGNNFNDYDRAIEFYGSGNDPDTIYDNRIENCEVGLAIAPAEFPVTANATANTSTATIKLQIHCNKFSGNTIAIAGSGNLEDQIAGITEFDADAGNKFVSNVDWDFIWQDGDTPLVSYYTSKFSDTPNHSVLKPLIFINSIQVTNSNFKSLIEGDFGSGVKSIENNPCRAFLKTDPNIFTAVEKVKEELTVNAKIYPNPFNNSISIEVKKEIAQGNIVVFDILGKEVLRQQFSGNNTQIQTGQLSSGFYILMIMEGTEVLHTEKMIKAQP